MILNWELMLMLSLAEFNVIERSCALRRSSLAPIAMKVFIALSFGSATSIALFSIRSIATHNSHS